MEERLKLFLAMEGISPAILADRLGVQRSNISHLLAGRNKPSFEFINKLLVEYPKINPDWLILGKGKAYREDSSDGTEYPEKLPAAEPAPLPESRLDLGLFGQILTEAQPSTQQRKAETETEPSGNLKDTGNQSPALIAQPAVEKEDTPE
ncbi:MAG: helix-turn-helix transcriptional regulator, partial [Bacteroidales bacterium]|nr:helix-turn-helix transcriptional regulator [Bacteroidales bacterium]